MKVCVYGNVQQLDEITSKSFLKTNEVLLISDRDLLAGSHNFDLYILLEDSIGLKNFLNVFKGRPVLINSVSITLKELSLPANFHRFNGWNTFLSNQLWEIVFGSDDQIKQLLEQAGITYQEVSDVPGFISPRVVSMIINEAYFALEEGVASKKDVDLAMKLGTNYPYGPFEWVELIGKEQVAKLLEKMALTNIIYAPSQLLKEEISAT